MLYTAPFSVSATTIVKAKAFHTGMTDSVSASGTFTIVAKQTVTTPIFTPAPGTYAGSVYVSLSCATAGATIRYTTNGSEPTATSAQFTSPLKISAATAFKAKAFHDGMTDSADAAVSYVVGLSTALLSA